MTGDERRQDSDRLGGAAQFAAVATKGGATGREAIAATGPADAGLADPGLAEAGLADADSPAPPVAPAARSDRHAGTAEPPPAEEMERIVQSRHDQPHRLLGPHPVVGAGGGCVVRAFLPQAARVSVRAPAGRTEGAVAMRRVHAEGLFQAALPQPAAGLDYDLWVEEEGGHAYALHDPYRFTEARFTAEDDALFASGRHLGLHALLGAHLDTVDGVSGVRFAVWAPNVARVSVVGGFNGWDGRRHPMQRLTASGVWELFVPGVAAGDLYKFELKTADGSVFLKGDPFAMRTEPAPYRAGIVCDLVHEWQDAAWMEHGRQATLGERGLHATPLPEGALAAASPTAPADALDALLRPLADAGFTAVQLPADPQAASLLASAAPSDDPPALLRLIDACHRHGLAVVLADLGEALPDGCADLPWFDGTRLYERPEPPARPGSPTSTLTPTPAPTPKPPAVFDLGKGEVRSVLLSRLAFWLQRYHVDALATNPTAVPALIEAGIPAVRLLVCPSDGEPARLSPVEIGRLEAARHEDPYAVLGPHPDGSGGCVVRALLPDADELQVLTPERPETVWRMRRVGGAGLFELRLPSTPAGYRLRVFRRGEGGRTLEDPYSFRDFTFGAHDQHLFGAGNHYRIYEKLGAHPRVVRGPAGEVAGVSFAVWAPNADGVSVVGPCNGWDGRVHQMKRHGVSGVWEVFVPGIGEGELYKFEMRARNGHVFLKTDPYALYTEVPPATASVVCRIDGIHDWQDQAWMERRSTANPWQQAIAIYEVHLGSWMRGPDGRRLGYRELAAKLVPYVKGLGFTHVELLPIAEHPYEPSWGYQVSNFYAPTSRFGGPADFMAFVDACHAEGIGVILDWVSGHFPKDAHALAWFDGTHLYEHADPRKGEHPDWGTLIFNYGRHEVENFLIANALFWLEVYHVDGLRVDAVASMLYLDYSRGVSGNWIPNAYGGRENLEAIEFIKHTNAVVHARFPGVLMIAEESTSWPKVSRPAHEGGLGFGFKWNMGWMHDALAYMSVPPDERKWHHGRLTFGLVYAFNENFILSLSHDEVVHMKRSLFNKMPGEAWEKFANLRLLFAFMYAHPGKKLVFMGGEIGQEGEWDHAGALDWRALEKKPNRALGWLVQELNRLYRDEPSLHEMDFKGVGFEWLEVENGEESIIAFLRKARDPRVTLLFAANFSAISRPEHRIGVPFPVAYELLFDSNDARYGGFGAPRREPLLVHAEEVPWHGREFSIRLRLPALTAVLLRPAAAGVG